MLHSIHMDNTSCTTNGTARHLTGLMRGAQLHAVPARLGNLENLLELNDETPIILGHLICKVLFERIDGLAADYRHL